MYTYISIYLSTYLFVLVEGQTVSPVVFVCFLHAVVSAATSLFLLLERLLPLSGLRTELNEPLQECAETHVSGDLQMESPMFAIARGTAIR